MSARSRITDTWRPLLGVRYAEAVASRKLSVGYALLGQWCVWIVAWILGSAHLVSGSLLFLLFVAPGAVTIVSAVRFARFGRGVRRDLREHGIEVHEVLYARNTSDVEQWALRNQVDLQEVARIGDAVQQRKKEQP